MAAPSLFDGRDIHRMAPRPHARKARARPHISDRARGFPQLPQSSKTCCFTAREQQGERLFPALFLGAAVARQEAALRERAIAVARRLNLIRVANDPAADLSGGQKKLLEIGRALMADPKLILLDEPVAGVNPSLAKEIEAHLRALAGEGMTILLIEHRMDTVAQLCDRVVVFAEGQNLAAGSFAEVAQNEHVQEAYMGRRRWAA